MRNSSQLREAAVRAVLADVEAGEEPVALSDLPHKPYVPKRDGRHIAIATIFRWVQTGKLEAAKIGGRLCTTRAAWIRFSLRESGAQVSPSGRSPAQRERSINRAEGELASAGL